MDTILQTTDAHEEKGKVMQFIKDAGGKLIVGILLALAGFLWGTAENKGATLKQIEVNTATLQDHEKRLRSVEDLKVEISNLRGDINALRVSLESRRR